MRASQFFISTLKEAPAEAELASHRLMLRAGLIKKLGSGLYSWMPMGLRVLRKVENIVREEMNRAGAIELLMPLINPAELWQETGRWEKYGPNMLRMKDRHDRDFLFAPTHEEVITDIVRKEIGSYRQLPVNFYHIGDKFRDEVRPRFGVMRAREFIMKDAYSFDRDKDGLMASYRAMYDAYTKIFTRLGLEFRPVDADNGEIGGASSHEFQVLADSGEDVIAFCPTSTYAANIEKAEAVAPGAPRAQPGGPMQKVATPGMKTCEAVAEFLGVPLQLNVKSVMFFSDAGFCLLLVRGDHSVNEVKIAKLPQLKNFRAATPGEIEAHLGTDPGYCGPVPVRGAHAGPVLVIADRTVAAMSDFVCGANESGHHLTGVNWGRDLPEPDLVADLRSVVAGDPSPDGQGVLELCRGIEVGHVFALGTVYSEAMRATVLDEQGHAQVMHMGCYGIGVTRVVAAAIEQHFDEKGIVWPLPMAPFAVVIAPIGYGRNPQVKEAAICLHDELAALGVEVLLDDRDVRPGVMFADLELIGIPHRVTIGDRGLKEGKVEYQARTDAAATGVPFEGIVAFLQARMAARR
ncbi:MAG: proline--tRNA ligase [Betaproteobacteria bacterium]|nr:proline--tRNA ligase [Betaproteobacteria bacterium]